MRVTGTGDSLQREAYSSWRHPTECLFRAFTIVDVLELGPGRWSTPWLLDKPIRRLTSVETSREWADLCVTDDPRHRVELADKPYMDFQWLEEWNQEHRGIGWDLALVDGHSWSRVHCLNLLMAKDMVRLIVVHDWEEVATPYNWEVTSVPPGWEAFSWRDDMPRSGVFAHRRDVETLLGEMPGLVHLPGPRPFRPEKSPVPT